MPITKVLIVDSVDDSLTRRRHAKLASSQLLENITLDYCYAIELSESAKAELDHGLEPEFELTEDTLFQRVDHAIQSFQPNYVMVHSGFVYRRYPEVYDKAFTRLKQSHPIVRFGIQHRPGI